MSLYLPKRFASHTGATGKYRTRIRNADGTLARDWSAWRKNLILDNGLNNIATNGRGWGNMCLHAQVGTGNLAVQKDTTSSGVTLTQAGTTTVTSSGNFFASTDVGALIKFDSGSAGQEVYITAFVSATQVTVGATGTHTAAFAVVYQVQQTTLQTFFAGDNGTFEADVVTNNAAGSPFPYTSFKRGYQFAAVGSNVTFKELGFGWQASGSLWSRVVIPGTGDALVTGQIYEVEYLLTVYIPGGASQVAFPDISGGLFNTAGTYIVGGFTGSIYQAIDASSVTRVLDPGYATATGWMALCGGTWTQPSIIATTGGTSTSPAACDTNSVDAYSSGTFQRTRRAHWNIGTGNMSVLGFLTGTGAAGTSSSVKFTTPVTKTNTHTIDIVEVVSWQRYLTN